MNHDTVHIVGCGTLGSNLLFYLAKNKIFKIFHLYDNDVVTGNEKHFPLSFSNVKGIYKSDSLSITIPLLFKKNGIRVISHRYKVTDKFLDGFVIDCRDNKTSNISSTISISLDKYILIIDCLPIKDYSIFHNYYSSNTDIAVDYACCHIIKFIKEKKFNSKTIYNLKDGSKYDTGGDK